MPAGVPRLQDHRRVRVWLICAALALPASWPYVTHYAKGIGDLRATGFIMYDMPYYMADAREYFDNGSLTYGNPFSPSYETPAIYFQPLTLFLGILWRCTHADPGLIFVCFGAVAALVCARAIVALYEEIADCRTLPGRLGLVAFCWGGGLLALAGVAANALTGRHDSIFRFDPESGWWFLNLGRNMVFPTEAFYHALVLGAIVCVLRRRFALSLALAFAVSVSHPFTGVEFLAILAAWSGFELCVMKNDQLPWWFFVGCVGLLVLHLSYYLWFLNLFPEHRQLAAQWTLPWLLRAQNFIPAFALVGALTAWSIRRRTMAQTFFADSRNRLFSVWFAVAWILSKHELFVRPIQPLHFTRGYIWAPLFLMGAPALLTLFGFLMRLTPRIRVLGIASVMALLLSDNILWLGSFTFKSNQGIRLARDEADLLDWMNARENKGFVILSDRSRIGYLAMTYSPLRSWYSHWANTPQFQRRTDEANAYFRDGAFLDQWKSMPLLIVYTDRPGLSSVRRLPPLDQKTSTVFHNTTFTVLRSEPNTTDR